MPLLAKLTGTQPMRIVLNGEPRQTGAATLAELLVSLDMAGAKVATALNGNFVGAKMREAATLGEGDMVEIVTPRQGG